MNGKIRIVVKVAEKRDGKAFQPGRPTPECNFLANDSRTVGRNQRGVGSERGHSRGRCEANKFSSGRRKKRQSVSGPYAAGLRGAVSTSRITRIRGFAIYRVNCLHQKLNVACNSILRLAAVPGENGPP